MRLTVFNGSPKKGKSNTEVLMSKFIEGFCEASENECKVYRLNSFKNLGEAMRIFGKSENIIFAFPMYNYSMPAGLKEFFERLEPLVRLKMKKRIGFVVQYGFPEAIHARALEKYLEKLCGILKSEYLGTIIRGGCNNLASDSKIYTKKILNGIYNIGKNFGTTSLFDKKMIDKYSRPEKGSFLMGILIRFIIGQINKNYWGAELKKNGVFETSFARPYQE